MPSFCFDPDRGSCFCTFWLLGLRYRRSEQSERCRYVHFLERYEALSTLSHTSSHSFRGHGHYPEGATHCVKIWPTLALWKGACALVIKALERNRAAISMTRARLERKPMQSLGSSRTPVREDLSLMPHSISPFIFDKDPSRLSD
jgi:hypothetical protein